MIGGETVIAQFEMLNNCVVNNLNLFIYAISKCLKLVTKVIKLRLGGGQKLIVQHAKGKLTARES